MMNLKSRLNKLEQNAKEKTRCPKCSGGKLGPIVIYTEGEEVSPPQPCELCGEFPEHGGINIILAKI